jgi:hypothetical protein
MNAPMLFVGLPLLPEVRARVAARRATVFSESDSPLSTDAVIAAAKAHCATAVMVSVGQELDAASIARLPPSVSTIATYSVG